MERRPDFIVIGAMKAGTTSLFQWLGQHPGCRTPAVKEPHFFSREEVYRRGPAPYLALFADIPDDLLTGEASASYADPRIADRVAARMHELVPDVRLVYLVRDPVARLKSHYLHEWQRSRERRPFAEAIAAPDNPYVAMSRYADVAAPFRERFGTDRLLVVSTDDLSDEGSPGWHRVTDHLGLEPVSGSGERANVSATKMAFTPGLLRLWESGVLDRAARLPTPVRAWGRRLLARGVTEDLRRQAATVADAEVPAHLVSMLHAQWNDLGRSAEEH